MTTVAWDGFTLAADSRVTSDIIEAQDFVKIIRFEDCLIGFAGEITPIIEFKNMLINRGFDKAMKKFKGANMSLLCILPTKVMYMDCENTFYHAVHKNNYAIGTGSHLAMGAIAAGASSYEAVKIAKKFDPYTGGKIRTLTRG